MASKVMTISELKERKKTRDRITEMLDRCRGLERDYREMEDPNMHQLMRLERQRLQRMLEALKNSNPDGD